jgi:NAD(P)-dependent dehydrogenase (short-subunit alcohol dehydrogenase family)
MKDLEGSKFEKANLLKGKKAVITGAGSGIGRQIAYTLAEQGAQVAVLDYKEELAEAAARIINDKFGEDKAFSVIGDVSNLIELKKSFNQIGEYFKGSLDIFVNNAGINNPNRIEDLLSEKELEKLNQMINVNQKGAYFCAALSYPLLLKGKDPIFIMIGSSASIGSEGQGVYSGTKASLRGLLGTLVKEWKKTEEKQAVRVSLVEPDYFEETGLRSEQYLQDLAQARRTTINKVSNSEVAGKKVPLGREGRLIEIGEKTVMMALDSYSSGNVEVLSGGKTIRL